MLIRYVSFPHVNIVKFRPPYRLEDLLSWNTTEMPFMADLPLCFSASYFRNLFLHIYGQNI